MRHLVLLFITALALYFGWRFAGPERRAVYRSALSQHGKWVAAIVLTLLALLVLAFYSPSLNIL